MNSLGVYLVIILMFLPAGFVNSQDLYVGKVELKPNRGFEPNQSKLLLKNSSPVAQNTTARIVSYPAQGLLFNFTPSYTLLNNKGLTNDTEEWKAKGNFGFNIEVGYFFKLNRIIGIGAGLGYSYYSSGISVDPHLESLSDTLDNGNDPCTFFKDINQLSEKLNVSYLDIPIYIEFGNPNIDQIGFYGRIGFRASFALINKLLGEENYTSWGYYDNCKVELHNIPELGYYTNKEDKRQEKVDIIKPVAFNIFFSGGITIPISNYLIFKMGANFNFGLSEIINWNSDGLDELKESWEYVKQLDRSTKTSLRSFGLEIGLIYNLRLY